MAVTKIANVVVPELFTPYVIRRTAELSKLVQSGIITANAELNKLITGGGKTLTMPKWNDLTGTSEVLSETTPLSPDNITTGAEVATVLYRGKAWGATELAGCLAGDDPMKAIGELVANWWVRDEQKILIKILDGIFGATDMADLTLNATTTALDAKLILDGKQLLGDAADKLTAIAMHSAVYTALQKLNLIQYIPNSRGEIVMPTYLGYRLIVDDSLPYTPAVTTTGSEAPAKFTTYLFANGVIGRGEGTPASLTPVETDRDSLASTDYLINRRAFVLHPQGMKWKGTPAGASASNDELATGTNWERVADKKQMGIVKVVHTI